MKARTFKLLVFIVLVAWLLLFTWPDLPRLRQRIRGPVVSCITRPLPIYGAVPGPLIPPIR